MARRGPWEAWEDDVVRELYPIHGPSWDRWGEVLPGRTGSSVANRARRLGVRMSPTVLTEARSRASAKGNATKAAKEAALEREVMALLDRGLPPSAIDVRLGLGPGTARRVISKRWRRKRNEEEREEDMA